MTKDRDVFKLCLKHIFGLSDHLIQRLRHIVSSDGEQHELDRAVKKIKNVDMKKLLSVIDSIDHNSSKPIKDKKMKNENVGITFESEVESNLDFKTFLENDAMALKAAGNTARQQGLGTQAQRRIAGNMNDKEFVDKQAQELKDLESSNDPIDRQILNLKRQLDRLYQQKAAKQQREQQQQQSAGM